MYLLGEVNPTYGRPRPRTCLAARWRTAFSRNVALHRDDLRPFLVLTVVVIHKCITDCLGSYTRTIGAHYSATTASIVGELMKAPLVLNAIAICLGPSQIPQVLCAAMSDGPFLFMLPALAYSAQNIWYLEALSHISAASYQILSQTKLFFTAVFMTKLMGRKFSNREWFALALLVAGSLVVQWSESSRNTGVQRNAVYGACLTILGALLSALPNVYFEKVLKTRGRCPWTANVQLISWSLVWLLVMDGRAMRALMQLDVTSSSQIFAGFSPWVWLLLAMQSFKCLLATAALTYSNNVSYLVTKPLSVALTAILSSMCSGVAPSVSCCLGGLLVMCSLRMFDV